MSQWVIAGSLGAILFNSGIITEEDVKAALDEQHRAGCRFGEALVRLGIVSVEDINWALSHHLDIPYIRLNREEIDQNIAIALPESIARRYGAVPIIRTDHELRVALSDPLDREAVREIEAACHTVVAVSIADERDIRALQDYLYGPELKGGFGLAAGEASADEAAAINADTTGARFLEWLLTLLTRHGYGSLTLEAPAGGGILTGRRGAVRRELGWLTCAAAARFAAHLRTRADLRQIGGGAEQGLLVDEREEIPAIGVCLLRGDAGDVITLRRVAPSGEIALPPELADRLRDLTARPGLVLLSLPDTSNVMELLESQQNSRWQRGVLLGRGTPALRERYSSVPIEALPPEEIAALINATSDHDPDILLIEDAGDVLLLTAAARAVLRGVRVTAGTGASITETFSLIFSAWRRSHLFPSAFRALVVGTVVPTLCPACREAAPVDAEEVSFPALPSTPDGYFHAPGCSACDFTGWGGAELLVDILPCDQALATV